MTYLYAILDRHHQFSFFLPTSNHLCQTFCTSSMGRFSSINSTKEQYTSHSFKTIKTFLIWDRIIYRHSCRQKVRLDIDMDGGKVSCNEVFNSYIKKAILKLTHFNWIALSFNFLVRASGSQDQHLTYCVIGRVYALLHTFKHSQDSRSGTRLK